MTDLPQKTKTFPEMRRRQLLSLAGLGVSGLLSGCITLLPKPGDPVPIVALRATQSVRRAAAPFNYTLGIGLPVLDQFLATDRLAAHTENGYAYIDGVRLSARAPISAQNVIMAVFDAYGSQKAIARGQSAARSDYEVQFDIQRFEVQLPRRRNDGFAFVSGTARLLKGSEGRLVASHFVESQAQAQRGTPQMAAAALSEALTTFALAQATWVASLGPQP